MLDLGLFFGKDVLAKQLSFVGVNLDYISNLEWGLKKSYKSF